MKWKRLVLIGLLGAIVALAVSVGGLYMAVSTAQPYYQTALLQAPELLEEQSQKLESRLTALHNDATETGQWESVVSAEELNGWLATKLPEAFPNLLPKNLRDPRIAITPDAIYLAARSDVAGVDTVVTVVVEPFVTAEGDLAIELRQVLAGMLPLPSKEIIDKLVEATRSLELPIRWTQNGGNSVVVVERRLWDTDDQQHRRLEAIELAEGELFLSGRTEKVGGGQQAVGSGGMAPAPRPE